MFLLFRCLLITKYYFEWPHISSRPVHDETFVHCLQYLLFTCDLELTIAMNITCAIPRLTEPCSKVWRNCRGLLARLVAEISLRICNSSVSFSMEAKILEARELRFRLHVTEPHLVEVTTALHNGVFHSHIAIMGR